MHNRRCGRSRSLRYGLQRSSFNRENIRHSRSHTSGLHTWSHNSLPVRMTSLSSRTHHQPVSSRAKAACKVAEEARKCAIMARECARLSQSANKVARRTMDDTEDVEARENFLELGKICCEAGLLGAKLTGTLAEDASRLVHGAKKRRR